MTAAQVFALLIAGIVIGGIIVVLRTQPDPDRHSIPVTGMTDPGAAVDEFFATPEMRQGETVSRRVICQEMSATAREWRGNAFAADVEERITEDV